MQLLPQPCCIFAPISAYRSLNWQRYRLDALFYYLSNQNEKTHPSPDIYFTKEKPYNMELLFCYQQHQRCFLKVYNKHSHHIEDFLKQY